MFERFTERARQVIVLAQEEARDLNHSFIGTEHILLGLLREKEGLAARVLTQYLSEWEARNTVVTIIGCGEERVTSPQIPLTPRAKKTLELSLREALSLGHNYIGTEHILLALIREEEGIAKRVLDRARAKEDDIRNDVMAILSGSSSTSRKAKKEQMAEERKKREAKVKERWQETQHKSAEETLKSDGQSESGPNSQKAQGIFTYGDWMLQIEEDTSGQPSIQIKSPFGSLSATFKR